MVCGKIASVTNPNNQTNLAVNEMRIEDTPQMWEVGREHLLLQGGEGESGEDCEEVLESVRAHGQRRKVLQHAQ